MVTNHVTKSKRRYNSILKEQRVKMRLSLSTIHILAHNGDENAIKAKKEWLNLIKYNIGPVCTAGYYTPNSDKISVSLVFETKSHLQKIEEKLLSSPSK